MHLNSTTPKLRIAALLALGLWIPATPAQTEPRAQTRHVHGVAELNLAIDANRVYIELTSPAANLFGFDHPPSDEPQRLAMRAALDILRRGDSLFGLPTAAGCHLIEAEFDNPLAEHREAQAEPHPHEHQEHADLIAEYRFECARPEYLDGLRAELFGYFPGLDSLRLYYVTERNQGAATLTADQNNVRF